MSMYMDYAAATPIRREVVEVMKQFNDEIYGNPSSLHEQGREARNAIETARVKVAAILNCSPAEIVFTAGGTESCNLAILGFARANKNKGNHIITSAVEHEAVLESCRQLEREGFKVTYLPVNHYGEVSIRDLENAVTDKTILASIMYANNEVGTIQPIRDAASLCNKRGISFHTDACQAGGILELDTKKLGISMMSLNGSKIYGPKQSGCLYVKSGIKLQPLIHGGGQESGLRSGTENVAGFVGFAHALELAQTEREKESSRLQKMRDEIMKGIAQIHGVMITGPLQNRLPNNASFCFKDLDSNSLLLILDENGLQASAGSACTLGIVTAKESHVLKAMKIPKDFIKGALRLSIGKWTTGEEVGKAVKIVKDAVGTMRA